MTFQNPCFRFVILILLVLRSPYHSQAAFPIRDSCAVITTQSAPEYPRYTQKEPEDYKYDKKGKEKVFGYMSLFFAATFVCAPLAIVFGAIGASRNRGARRAAEAGLALGCIEFGFMLLAGAFLLILLL